MLRHFGLVIMLAAAALIVSESQSLARNYRHKGWNGNCASCGTVSGCPSCVVGGTAAVTPSEPVAPVAKPAETKPAPAVAATPGVNQATYAAPTRQARRMSRR